jgi:DNA primase
VFERKIRILINFLGRCYRSSNEVLFHCPKCDHHKKKLSVNVDKNVFKCWICDYNGRDIYRLVRAYGKYEDVQDWKSVANIIDFSERAEEKEEEKISLSLPKEFITLTGNKVAPLSIAARKYLKSRGITEQQIAWWKMGYCPDGKYSNRIIIPSFDLEGELNYFISRAYDDNWMKYLNPPSNKDFIFNELYLDWNKDVTIVEGVFDAIVVGNAIPLLGSTLREDSYIFQKIVDKCDKVYIALDEDAKKKESKIGRILTSYGVDVYRVDTSGFEDVGEMDSSIFHERKKSAEFLSLDNYLLERILFQ